MSVPTYLYIKKHNVTGLMYFGKTIQNPMKYKGSGIYWKNHLREHGNDVTTIWHNIFFDKEALTEFANFFSEYHKIVTATDSSGKKIWANCLTENGLDGGQNAGVPSPLRGAKTGRSPIWKGQKDLNIHLLCGVGNKPLNIHRR